MDKRNVSMKCPICNSSKYIKGSKGYHCLNCNFRNLKENKEIRLNEN
jgi:hypothetical protein